MRLYLLVSALILKTSSHLHSIYHHIFCLFVLCVSERVIREKEDFLTIKMIANLPPYPRPSPQKTMNGIKYVPGEQVGDLEDRVVQL